MLSPQFIQLPFIAAAPVPASISAATRPITSRNSPVLITNTAFGLNVNDAAAR